MTAPYVFTFSDAIERLRYFVRNAGGPGTDDTLLREIVREAYREVASSHNWSFLHRTARIALRAPQTTGTVSFDLTGGTWERMLTLSGSTWPDWAKDASVRLADPPIVCDIAEVKSETVVVLEPDRAPIEDIASTTYKLYPRWYRLPNDFQAMYRPLHEEPWVTGTEANKETIEMLNRYEDREGSIERYAIAATEDLFGSMALYIHPPSNEAKTLDIPYLARPRDIVYSGRDPADCAGTISVVAGSAAVTGSGTSFESGMEGAIIRWYSSSSKPDGLNGPNRYVEQRSIFTVSGEDSLVMDDVAVTTRSGVGYRISDAIDIDVSALNAFLHCAEWRAAEMLRLRERADYQQRYYQSLRQAKGADNRYAQIEVVGRPRVRAWRLADSTDRDYSKN